MPSIIRSTPKKRRSPDVTRFTYRVFWSTDDECHVGTCVEFPSLSHLGDSMQGALNGISDLVADVVTDLRREKSPIPSPIASKRFSGAFKVRIPPMIHHRLAVEAAEQGVSLNRLVSAKLSA